MAQLHGFPATISKSKIDREKHNKDTLTNV
jgi:hypothetical protein